MIHRCLGVLIALIALYAPMTINSQEDKSAAPQPKASHDRPQTSQIDSLTKDKNVLQDQVDLWNILYAVGLVIALVIGGFTAFAQLRTILLSKRFVSVQSQVDSEKDRIAEQQTAQLKSETSKTTERARQLEVQAESLRAGTATANARAKEAELKTLQLQARMIPLNITKAQERELSARLAEIPGMVVNLITHPGLHILPDPRSGERIWLAFGTGPAKDRGWDVRLLLTPDIIAPGIVVRVRRRSDASVSECADRIVRALEAIGIAAAVRGPDFEPAAETPIGYGANAFKQWDENARIWIFVGN